MASRQSSAVGWRQARALGASVDALRRRVASGEWRRATDRVLVLEGTAPTFEQRCWVALLDAGEGALLSHTTAAALFGLPGFDTTGSIHVTRPRRRAKHPSTVATIHEPRFLPDRHARVLPSGLRVTGLPRTLFDLAGTVHQLRTARAIDNALNRKLVDLEVLRAVTIEMLARGRKGSKLMRRLLMARGAGYIPPASGLEARFHARWIAAGNPPLRPQVDSGGAHWVGRVDYRDPDVPLIVEVDGDLGHTALLDLEADDERDRSRLLAGRTTWEPS